MPHWPWITDGMLLISFVSIADKFAVKLSVGKRHFVSVIADVGLWCSSTLATRSCMHCSSCDSFIDETVLVSILLPTIPFDCKNASRSLSKRFFFTLLCWSPSTLTLITERSYFALCFTLGEANTLSMISPPSNEWRTSLLIKKSSDKHCEHAFLQMSSVLISSCRERSLHWFALWYLCVRHLMCACPPSYLHIHGISANRELWTNQRKSNHPFLMLSMKSR